MKQVKVNAMAYAQLVRHMLPGEMTCEELAQETGLHLVTVYHYTREMHAAGAAHIARYEADAYGRHTIKVYRIGAGKDAPRVRLTQVQRQARSRERKRAAQQLQVLAGKGRYVQSANGRLRYEEVV